MSKCPLTNNSCEKYSCEWYMREHDECAICTCARMIRNLKECWGRSGDQNERTDQQTEAD